MATSSLKVIALVTALVFAVVFASEDTITAQDVLRPAPGDAGPYVVTLKSNQGPYSLDVWQSPERAVAGTVRFILELRDRSGSSIGNATANLYGTPAEGGRAKRTPMLNANIAPHFYYGSLELEDPGEWDLRFEVAGPEGTVILNSSVIVSERSRSGAFFQPATWLFLGLQLALFGGVIFLWIRSRKRITRLSAEEGAASAAFIGEETKE